MTTTHLVAVATKCQHGAMTGRQRTFRLNEPQTQAWETALEESGLKQQKAMETIAEAIGAGLINLSALRAELVRLAKASEAE